MSIKNLKQIINKLNLNLKNKSINYIKYTLSEFPKININSELIFTLIL